jgi:Peptidase A4 family
MLSKQFAVLTLAVAVSAIAFHQISIAPDAQATNSLQAQTQALKALHHAPMRRVGNPSPFNTTAESFNWSGYAVTGSDFTDAVGSWTVPTFDCNKSPNAWEVSWVGIDGYASDTVEQTGTGIWCNKKVPNYFAWYEFYPADSVIISTIPTSPGDNFSAEVSYKSSEFTVEIKDETTGKKFSTTQSVSGAARSSAEWIVEAPSAVTGILNLADFGLTSFGSDNSATNKKTSGTISAFSSVKKINMEDDTSYKESEPSTLSPDGSSFTVKWIEYN